MNARLETHFIRPLADFYGRNPFGPGFVSRLEPYAATLNEEVLQSVATKLIEKGGKSFPSLVACRMALQNAETAMSAPMSTELRPWQHQERDRADWRARLDAVKLCRCRMGEVADREGWLPSLIEFCQDTGRLPNDREIPGVRAKSRRSEDALEKAKGSPFYVNLVAWRQNMIDRAHRDVFEYGKENAA